MAVRPTPAGQSARRMRPHRRLHRRQRRRRPQPAAAVALAAAAATLAAAAAAGAFAAVVLHRHRAVHCRRCLRSLAQLPLRIRQQTVVQDHAYAPGCRSALERDRLQHRGRL
eukprot:scaffold25904_cov67-Phaeocystis_antarctica.AAC.2